MKLFSLFAWIFPVRVYQTNVAAAVIGGTVVGGLMSADAQRSAGNAAADAQMQASQLGVDEQRRQFNQVQELLRPYTLAGTNSLTAQQNLLGLNGNDAQGAAIQALQNSPQFATLTKLGENAILQNASATGGLRGGNVQAALAQYRPQVLAQLINDQYSRLGGLTSVGENAAAMTGNAGMSTGNNITNLLQQSGAAQAGAALAAGRANAGFANSISNGIGLYAGMGGFGGIGGSPAAYATGPGTMQQLTDLGVF